MVRPQFLQRRIGIFGLVGCIAVDKQRSLIGHHLLEDRGDRLALGEPLPPDFSEQFGRVALVEHDRAGRPAIGEALRVEVVEQSRKCRAWKPDYSQRAQMRCAKPRFEPSAERFIGEQRIDIAQGLAHFLAQGVVLGGEEVALGEPFGQGGFDPRQRGVDPG